MYYRLYKYVEGGIFTLVTEKKFEAFSEAWLHYYNDGRHLGSGFYMIVKSTPNKPDEIVSTYNVR